MQELYATIDLGSNSFHMLTAAVEHDEIKILDSISDKVMLAEGLSKKNGIHPDAMQRGLECIQRFSQRITQIPKENIRIVGTNTLRAAINSDIYVAELEKLLGDIPIEVVTGIEEARLIYLGVNHSWCSLNNQSKNLVLDIGGGSTEIILGKSFKLKQAESLRMGCVAYRRFFPNDEICKAHFNKAVKAAKYELSSIQEVFDNQNWLDVIGSAGTFKAIEQILIANQLSDEGITKKSLKQLKKIILNFNSMHTLDISGLKNNRHTTIVPGVAIALAIFQTFDIDRMFISRGGLREGILYDLLGRLTQEDIRQRSIEAIAHRYKVSSHSSQLMTNTCLKLLNHYKSHTDTLKKPQRDFLLWAAQACRIGLAINHSQYNIHSAYLIKHSELSGFSIKQKNILACIVKNHRRKIHLKEFDTLNLSKPEKTQFIQVIFLLRLTSIITQNGNTNQCNSLQLEFSEQSFRIFATNKWLEKHTLIKHALNIEKRYWKKAGFSFELCKDPK